MVGEKLDIVGFEVVSVDVGDDFCSTTLVRSTDGRTLTLRLEGDCCSRTYWEADSVRLLRGLVGRTLTSIEQRGSGRPNETDDGGYVYKYGCLVVTHDQGAETLDWRNESNGYYNGWVEWSWSA